LSLRVRITIQVRSVLSCIVSPCSPLKYPVKYVVIVQQEEKETKDNKLSKKKRKTETVMEVQSEWEKDIDNLPMKRRKMVTRRLSAASPEKLRVLAVLRDDIIANAKGIASTVQELEGQIKEAVPGTKTCSGVWIKSFEKTINALASRPSLLTNEEPGCFEENVLRIVVTLLYHQLVNTEKEHSLLIAPM
jgi:hypothetical protein